MVVGRPFADTIFGERAGNIRIAVYAIDRLKDLTDVDYARRRLQLGGKHHEQYRDNHFGRRVDSCVRRGRLLLE